jgi:SAM-dependent methyltransferase
VEDSRYDGAVPATPDAYDRLPYTDNAYAESHPDRLAVVARLARWTPAGVASARVLELGCGRGGNLLPMAASLPGASFVGVDRSQRQIEEARAVAFAAAVANVTLVHGRFEDALPSGGPFDFVVAHGVCSWVPPEARRALLRAIAAALAPGGVGYVSFNVLPGWYGRMAARDWLRAHRDEDPRAAIAWLRAQVSPELADYRRRLEAVERRLAETERAYAVHEYLADDHHPLHVGELLAEAAHAGLKYLGDAIPAETAAEMLPEGARARLGDLDVAGAQRLVDFVRDTAFRRALFVRADEAAARGWRWGPELDAAAIDGLRVASRLRPHGPAGPAAAAERFDAAGVSVHVAHAGARAALRALAAAAPRSLPFSRLAEHAGAGGAAELRGELFDLWLATGAVDLHAHEPALADGTSARPAACPVARWHAVHGGPLTNRWHQEVRLDELLLRSVLARLDGTRTIADLARDAACTEGDARAAVAALAAAALLVA